jgi:hypothetical protein
MSPAPPGKKGPPMDSRMLQDDDEDLNDIENSDDIDHGDTDDELAESIEDEFGNVLHEALELYAEENELPSPRICSFADAGYLTMNRGLVVRMGGATFELTIVRRS